MIVSGSPVCGSGFSLSLFEWCLVGSIEQQLAENLCGVFALFATVISVRWLVIICSTPSLRFDDFSFSWLCYI